MACDTSWVSTMPKPRCAYQQTTHQRVMDFSPWTFGTLCPPVWKWALLTEHSHHNSHAISYIWTRMAHSSGPKEFHWRLWPIGAPLELCIALGCAVRGVDSVAKCVMALQAFPHTIQGLDHQVPSNFAPQWKLVPCCQPNTCCYFFLYLMVPTNFR